MAKGARNELIFRIPEFDPLTLPMARLAEYITQLAVLYGERDHIHLLRVAKGSAALVKKIDSVAIEKVRLRVRTACNTPDSDTAGAYYKIDDLLFRDHATGAVYLGGAKILQFPGKKRAKTESIGPIAQQDFIDGQLIRLGGKDETVPVHVRDEDGIIHPCTANIDVASRLGPLYLKYVRVHGTAHWNRDEAGQWERTFFRVDNVEELDHRSLKDAVRELRAMEGPQWPTDIMERLYQLRSE
ncbi:MAG: hypothetical protein ABSC93_28260 [Bryobacteraceae bacterium]|jgi:hypothetical protein